MDHAASIEGEALIAAGNGAALPAASADDLSWAVVQMRAGARIIVNEPLIAAYQAASSPHSIRALKSDLEAFDLWCRRTNRIAFPATPGAPAAIARILARVAGATPSPLAIRPALLPTDWIRDGSALLLSAVLLLFAARTGAVNSAMIMNDEAIVRMALPSGKDREKKSPICISGCNCAPRPRRL